MRFPGRPTTSPILGELRARFRKFDQNVPLERLRFTVMDTELTGLSRMRDHIVSIGAVRITEMTIRPEETFQTLARCDRLPKTSTLIHRITPSALSRAPELTDRLPDLVRFIGPSLIVGHHIGLDMGFLNRACRNHLGASLPNPCLDTLRLARIHDEQLWENYYDRFTHPPSYRLEDLAERFALPRFPAHDALNDALQTAYLFLYLVGKLRRDGVTTLRDLHRLGRTWRWYL